MDFTPEHPTCFCGEAFASPAVMRSHRSGCPSVREALIAEYRRISAENEGATVRKALWNANVDKRLPRYETIAKWYGCWSNFIVTAAGGEVVMTKRYRVYMPPADPLWPHLLTSDMRFVTRYATTENIRVLYAHIVATAIDEAEESLSHWADDATPDELAQIVADARSFLIDENLSHLVPEIGA